MKILTVGTATMDVIATVSSDNVERMTMHNATSSFLLLEQGRKIDAEQIAWHAGGGAVNSAVALRRLGHRVAAFVKIGADRRGDELMQHLAAQDIGREFVLRDARAPTAVTVMLSAHDRDVTVITHRGANTTITREEVPLAAIGDQDMVFITNLSDESADVFPVVARAAKQAGAIVASNPGIRQLSSRARAFIDTLPSIDLLVLNRAEAEALLPALVAAGAAGGAEAAPAPSAPALLRRGLNAGGFVMGLRAFLEQLHARGPKLVALTDGRHGAYLLVEDKLLYCPALKVTAAGTAGAGDAFVATLAGLWATGRPAELCLRAAAVNAASVVSFVDTQSGLLDLRTLEARTSEEASALPVSVW